MFYKLIQKICLSHWMFLYKWYKSLLSVVKWNSNFSHEFSVKKGTKQGSIISPSLFNIFIDDLLIELHQCDTGVRVGKHKFNSSAYADDIHLLNLTMPGLQRLIDVCYKYSKKWRFNFGLKKTKCLISGKYTLKCEPSWTLGGKSVENVDSMEILGVHYTSDGSSDAHIESRVQASRRAMYSLTAAGCAYPGLSSDVKTYLWKCSGLAALSYGLDTLDITKKSKQYLESVQASTLKRLLGLPIRSHSSQLMSALNVRKVSDIIGDGCISLWNRIFMVDSPARVLCARLLADYILYGSVIPGSLLGRLVSFGVSPLKSLFGFSQRVQVVDGATPHENGVVDSLRYLVMHENFIKPYSDEHVLARLLTKAF